MCDLRRWFGVVWSLPATLLGRAYVFYLSKSLCRECRYDGMFGEASVYHIVDCPAELRKKLELEPLVIGSLIIMHEHPRAQRYNAVILKHAQKHVEHWMVFGVFTPIVRLFVKSVLKAFGNVDMTYDDPFEISARRHADQTIDIPGIRKRLSDASKRSKL